jgi:glycine/D-amino acid oxidase-like deaminating enzyme
MSVSDDPYWWRTGGIDPDAFRDTAVPAEVDVAVVGSGVGGLSASLELAAAGVSVCLLDAGPIGGGASTRNFASAGSAIALTYARDLGMHGEAEARSRLVEQAEAYAAFVDMATSADHHCGLVPDGVIFAALNDTHLRGLAAAAAISAPVSDPPATMLDRRALGERIATDAYAGGVLLHDGAEFDAGRFVAHLIGRAAEGGVVLASHRPVRRIERQGGRFRVEGQTVSLSAGRVVVAINGYLGELKGAIGRFLDRRLIPLQANMIATEELPAEQIGRAFLRPTCFADTRRNFYCVRLSPDRKRILFASRTGKRLTTAQRTRALGRDLEALFPQLGPLPIAHSWPGMIAMPRDRRSHVGTAHGVDFVGGCSGSGMVRHFGLGRKLAARIVDPARGASTYANAMPALPPMMPKRAVVRAMTVYYDMIDTLAQRR